MRLLLVLFSATFASAQELPLVSNVEYQPLAAQVQRVVEALDYLGEPLPASEKAELKRLTTVADIQRILGRSWSSKAGAPSW